MLVQLVSVICLVNTRLVSVCALNIFAAIVLESLVL